MNQAELSTAILSNRYDGLFSKIYSDPCNAEYQRDRYAKLISNFTEIFGDGEIMLFSAPGRTEIGGNHTDHQHGEVLAAAVNVDMIAAVRPSGDMKADIRSEGYPDICVDLRDLSCHEEERRTSSALIRGIAAAMKKNGYSAGGFKACITSDVPAGSGLSSSAAFEVLIGNICSELYNSNAASAEEIAVFGKYAENIYFGKPSGLMDQTACSVGGMVHIDFAEPEHPNIEKLDIDPSDFGYCLCITETGGSHADLTDDYAAITEEMGRIAGYFGKSVLLGVSYEDIVSNISELRRCFGDRAVLRAMHFVDETKRAGEETEALKRGDMEAFLGLVCDSGNSSIQCLQNVYSCSDPVHQGIVLAISLSQRYLGRSGVCRVHGGGFAGTVQAWVRTDAADEYRSYMDRIFGSGSSRILRVRRRGGGRVI